MFRIDRKKWYNELDWRVTHATPLQLWEQRQWVEPTIGPYRRLGGTRDYLRWFYSVTRVSVKPPRHNNPIEDLLDTDDEDEGDIVDEYDDLTRAGVQPERAPIQNYMVSQSTCTLHLEICVHKSS